jgi:tetratricopeptide (TPR) repeat protein/biotin operon repressor
MRLGISPDGFVTFHGMPLRLPPKERAVLRLLVAACPEPVSKDRFADEVWRGADMADDSLVRCISQLRRLLSQDAGVEIQSVYGFGYRLVPTPQDGPQAAEVGGCRRLAEIAAGEVTWAETVLHVRSIMDRRDMAALERAVNLLRDLVSRAPSYIPARLLLAECLAELCIWVPEAGRDLLDEAGHQLRVVERRSRQAAGLTAMRAHLLDLEWRFEESAELHASAAERDPDDPVTHYNRAMHFSAFGRHAETRAALRQALALRPHSVKLALALSRAEYAAGAYREAMDTAERVRAEAEHDAIHRAFIVAQEAYITGQATDGAERIYAACCDSYIFKAAHLSYHFALRGENETAVRIMQETPAGVPARDVSFIPALIKLDLLDEAMRRAETAARSRLSLLPVMLHKPETANLARHPGHERLYAAVFGQDRTTWPRPRA